MVSSFLLWCFLYLIFTYFMRPKCQNNRVSSVKFCIFFFYILLCKYSFSVVVLMSFQTAKMMSWEGIRLVPNRSCTHAAAPWFVCRLQIHQDLREDLAKVKTLDALADVSKQLKQRCQVGNLLQNRVFSFTLCEFRELSSANLRDWKGKPRLQLQL